MEWQKVFGGVGGARGQNSSGPKCRVTQASIQFQELCDSSLSEKQRNRFLKPIIFASMIAKRCLMILLIYLDMSNTSWGLSRSEY